MDIEILKTLTTQPQRQIYDSLFYNTVGRETCQQHIEAGTLLEYDEFAGHWYGIERADAEAILKQKHAVVSATPAGAEALRRSGLSTWRPRACVPTCSSSSSRKRRPLR